MEKLIRYAMLLIVLAALLSGCERSISFSLEDWIPALGPDATATLVPTRTATQYLPGQSTQMPGTPEVPVVPTVTSAFPNMTPEQPQITPTTDSPTEQVDQTPEASPTPTEEVEEAETASIQGRVIFPAEDEETPPFRVVAFLLESDDFYYDTTRKGDPTFELTDLPPGDYVIVAYIIPAPGNEEPDWAGGYSQAVLCGLGDECEDHALVVIVLESGDELTDITPGDWYAEPGLYPPDPTLQEE